jgi:uncharacterized membrane protein YeaQ/YmgE (transglycosylase-associated protein family)
VAADFSAARYNPPMGRLIEFAVLLAIAGVCGYAASQLMGAKRVNVVMLVALGLVGAFVGKFIAAFFHLPLIGTIHLAGNSFPVLWAMLGAVVVVGLVSAMTQH